MGRTALHYAAVQRDHNIMFKILTDAGADETVIDLVCMLLFSLLIPSTRHMSYHEQSYFLSIEITCL